MAIANVEGAETASPVAGRQMRNAIIASVLGWSLDLFDLFILLYVAPVVGALFFPSSVPTLSLAAVYASFAVTLLMRPVGSAVFGHYADVHGRKNAMFVAIVGVGISTAAFGLLPTIAQAGFIAPVLFLILRLVQGIFVGGVVASTHTIGTEWVSPNWRGAMSGLVGGGGAGIGALLASFVFLVMSSIFPGDAFAVWAVVGGGSGGSTTSIDIRISRYNTNEEIKNYAALLSDNGQNALRRRLEKEDVGRLSRVGSVGSPIAIARRLQNGDKTIIRVVTTRHMSFNELRNSGRSVDYPYTMLELVLGQDGKGTGTAIGAAKLRFDKKKNLYEIESLGHGTDYNKLLNVRTMD